MVSQYWKAKSVGIFSAGYREKSGYILDTIQIRLLTPVRLLVTLP